MGFLSGLFGNKNKYELDDLTPEVKNDILDSLKEAELIIIKYAGKLPVSKYDVNTLDLVFEKWNDSKDPKKELDEDFVVALGAALGQDIVNSLNCEWKIFTDKHGSELAVVHKTYHVFGFPYSSARKACAGEKEKNYFQVLKQTIKEEIQEAERSGKVEER